MMASTARAIKKASSPLLSYSSSDQSSTPRWKYDVFLSFRGEDTRKNFISHLYSALRQKGIFTFKDDKELERGENISDEILKAINSSRFAVIIFSRNYASSSWCLDELLTICDAMTEGRQTVFPIFYDVNPSEVEKQTGRFENAFVKHEEDFKDNIKQVERWRVAMTRVANISGWDLLDRDESEFIQDIAEKILSKLRKSSDRFSSLAKDFVGMDSRLEKLISYLDIEQLNDVRMIGIWGMGGIGKTTIARVVYDRMSSLFEGCCFLTNVRETSEKHGLTPLQEQLLFETLMGTKIKIWDVYRGMDEIRNRLCSRRVLIILDDVDQLEQLQSLAGMRDWFASGSRIIVTTRDEHLLICHGVDEVYGVESLDHDEAFQLFRMKAFKNDCPTEEYLELSEDVVKYANGLPLALDVLGSFLCGRSINEWKSALDRLKEIPPKKILDKLQISFGGLDEVEQRIFLDIACFFNGEGYKFVRRMLKGCGFHPDIGIGVLIEKSLITISENQVWMHDLLQEMGREIVRQESYREPGKRSRLWLHKDVYHVLKNDTVTKQVEGIVLHSIEHGERKLLVRKDIYGVPRNTVERKRVDFRPFEQEERHLSAKPFLKMKKLRLLKIHNLHISQDLEYLSSELRYLEWHSYPFKSLPSTSRLDKLIELRMQHSNIEIFWNRTERLEMLKVIDLSQSQNLIKITGFKSTPNLRELILEGCTKLIEVHESIEVLKRLVLLSLKDCTSLVGLPNSICNLKSLKVLNLDGCTKLDKLPERFGDLPCLEQLYASGIARRELASVKPWDWFFSIFAPKNPDPIALMLPSFSSLCSLRELELSYCNMTEGVIPNDLSGFPSLQSLNLSGNDFVSIPTSIVGLSKLEKLSFLNCKRLQLLPDLPSSIICLRLDGCTSLKTFPNPFEKQTSKPWVLTFANCFKLKEIQGAFAWLKSYLHFLLNNHHQENLLECDFSIWLPGCRIPGFFNNQEIGSSIRIQLPKDWCSNKCMGFLICAVFGAHEEPSLSGCFLRFDLLAGPTWDQLWLRDGTQTEIFEGVHIVSDQIWLIFIPLDNSKSAHWWNACTHFKASFSCDELNVKYCGFRVVYEQDVDELVQCNRPENLALPYYNHFDKSKQSLDDNTCDNEVEHEGDNSINQLHSGRSRMVADMHRRMAADPYTKIRTTVSSVKYHGFLKF